MKLSKIAYRFGPFVLERSECRLLRDGQTVDLRPKEFDLLAFLVEQAPHLIEMDELLEKVWKGNRSEWAVTSTLSRLKEKLKPEGMAYIEAVPTKGYRFVCPVEALGGMDRQTYSVEELMQNERTVKNYQRVEDIARELHSVMSLLNARFKMFDDQNTASFLFDLAQTTHQRLFGPEETTWFDRLEAEHDNVSAVLNYYRSKDAAGSWELELAVLLGHFWDIRGHWSEGREIFQHALAKQRPGTTHLKAKGLAWAGYLSLCQDDYITARQMLSDSIQMSRDLGNQECLAFAFHSLGVTANAQGNYQEARSLMTESLQYGQDANLDWLTGWNLRWMGVVAEAERDYESARELHLKSLSMSQQMQDLRGMAAAMDHLGAVARYEKNHAAARQYHEKSLALRLGVGNKWGTGNCYFNLGLIEDSTGQRQAARSFFQKSLALRREVGDRRGMAVAMEAIARMDEAAGERQGAARIFGAAEALRISIAAPLSPAEQKDYGRIRQSIKKRFAREWSEGSRSLIEIIARA